MLTVTELEFEKTGGRGRFNASWWMPLVILFRFGWVRLVGEEKRRSKRRKWARGEGFVSGSKLVLAAVGGMQAARCWRGTHALPRNRLAVTHRETLLKGQMEVSHSVGSGMQCRRQGSTAHPLDPTVRSHWLDHGQPKGEVWVTARAQKKCKGAILLVALFCIILDGNTKPSCGLVKHCPTWGSQPRRPRCQEPMETENQRWWSTIRMDLACLPGGVVGGPGGQGHRHFNQGRGRDDLQKSKRRRQNASHSRPINGFKPAYVRQIFELARVHTLDT